MWSVLNFSYTNCEQQFVLTSVQRLSRATTVKSIAIKASLVQVTKLLVTLTAKRGAFIKSRRVPAIVRPLSLMQNELRQVAIHCVIVV